MMTRSILAGVLGGACSAVMPAQTYKSQLAFTFGGEFIPSNGLAPFGSKINYTRSGTLELTYDREVHRFGKRALILDVPALVGPNHKISSMSPLLPTSIATFYVTPSARLNLTDDKRLITPWISAGFGYGLYETSDYFAGGRNNPTIHTHTGTAQFGGGVDVRTKYKLLRPLSARGEFRDFYTTSQPVYPVATTSSSQHNYSVQGGITARF